MVQCICCKEARAMGAIAPIYCCRGTLLPLPLSPLFSTMYKSNNGGGRGGGGNAIRHPKISESGPQPIDTLIYLYLHL